MTLERPKTLEEVSTRAGDAQWPDAIAGLKAVEEARKSAQKIKAKGTTLSFAEIRRLATVAQNDISAQRRQENGR